MSKLGSKKGFDPMPPDQYLTYQNKRYSPTLRLWAWVLAHTIRLGHRSPRCVDKSGRELTLKHASADLDMDPGGVRHAWVLLERENRVFRDGKRLCIRGEVVLPMDYLDKGEEKAQEVCTATLPPYILNQINKFTPEVRKAFIAEEETDRVLKNRLQAECVAGVRLIFDQRQDNRFQRFRLKKIRAEKRRAPAPEFVERVLPSLHGIVQTFLDPVRTSKKGCTEGKNGVAQTSVSLLPTEIQRKTSEGWLAGISVEGPVGLPKEPASQPALPDRIPAIQDLLHNAFGVALSAANLVDLRAIVQPAGPKFERIFAQFLTAAARKRRGQPLNRGLVLSIAKEAAEATEQLPPPRAAAPDARDVERDRLFAAEVLKNPDADEEQRAWARQVLVEEMRKGGMA
jgi:hypothetical protein